MQQYVTKSKPQTQYKYQLSRKPYTRKQLCTISEQKNSGTDANWDVEQNFGS